MDDDPVFEMPEPPRSRRPPPKDARCDACHERGARVKRTTDGLLAVCAACARGVDVSAGDSTEAIAALALRAPAGERRTLTRRLLARRSMHTARRERRVRIPHAPGVSAPAPQDQAAERASDATTSPGASTPL
jgi:hypothetical protein